MKDPIVLIALYSLIPFFLIIFGGVIGLFFTPNKKITSIMQHFVAGVILAAVAVDLLPKILTTSSSITIAIGFIVGVLLMLFLQWVSHRSIKTDKKNLSLDLTAAVEAIYLSMVF